MSRKKVLTWGVSAPYTGADSCSRKRLRGKRVHAVFRRQSIHAGTYAGCRKKSGGLDYDGVARPE